MLLKNLGEIESTIIKNQKSHYSFKNSKIQITKCYSLRQIQHIPTRFQATFLSKNEGEIKSTIDKNQNTH